MASASAFATIGVTAMLGMAWFTVAGARQLPHGEAQTVAAEDHRRERVTPIWTDHLKVTTYPGDAVAVPGTRTSLVIEVEPGADMHIYAPGAEGYKVITLTMVPQRFVRIMPLQYPAAETYVFAPLNERVSVYQKPFTLRQELVLDDRSEARAAFRGKPSLTVTGTLSYQACDDKICFNPVTVPLTWTVLLESAGRR